MQYIYRIKRILLTFLFVITFTLVSIFPNYASANFAIPTNTYNYDGYPLKLPDWSRTTFSTFPPFTRGGEINLPVDILKNLPYNPNRRWEQGTPVEQVIKLGDIADGLALERFTLEQIQQITGIDLRGVSLDDFKLTNWQTIADLIKAIPGLGSWPISESQLLFDFMEKVTQGQTLQIIETIAASTADVVGVEDIAIAELLEYLPQLGEIPLGDILDLKSYSLSDLPGITSSPIGAFNKWGSSLVSNIPGLNSVPFSLMGFGNPSRYAQFDLPWGEAEHGDARAAEKFISGRVDRNGSLVPVPCSPNKPCSYLELSDAAGEQGDLYGARFASSSTQEVEGGYGILKSLNNGKEPPGVLFDPAGIFKLAIASVSESEGQVETQLCTAITIRNEFVDTRSPYFICFPFLTYRETELMVLRVERAPTIDVPNPHQDEIPHLPSVVERGEGYVNLHVPHLSQRNNKYARASTCNVTSVAMILKYYGVTGRTGEPQLEDELYLYMQNAGMNRLVHTHLAQVTRAYGIKTSFNTHASWDDVKRHLDSGNPVIISGHYTNSGHILVIRGYNEAKRVFYVNDPWGKHIFGKQYQNVSGANLEYSYDKMYSKSYGGAYSTWAHFPHN